MRKEATGTREREREKKSMIEYICTAHFTYTHEVLLFTALVVSDG